MNSAFWLVASVAGGFLSCFSLAVRSVTRDTQRSNVFKYVRSVSNGFLYGLRKYFDNLELP